VSLALPPSEDRGVSPVASQNRLIRSPKVRKAAFVVVALAAVALAAKGVSSAINDPGPTEKPGDTGANSISQVISSPPPPSIVVVKADPAPSGQAAGQAAPAVVAGSIGYVRMPAVSGEASFDAPAPVAREDKSETAAQAAAVHDATLTKVAFKSSVIAGTKAGPALNMTYVMRPQLIPCALDTAMDSTLSGAIMCHTTQDVLSQDHILLMPVGTQIVGTYHNDVKTGQHRLFAFAGNAITKEGIPVPLDSGVADGLGRAGVEGNYDPHTWDRFGAALLLTGMDAAVQLGSAELSKGGNQTLNIGSTVGSGNGISSIAQEILRAQINIPPTITVSPGTIVSIVVDHPVSFEDAIKVSTR
jgi:type IV secretory pathway VirB10-like protein